MVSKATAFDVICYTSNRKLMHHLSMALYHFQNKFQTSKFSTKVPPWGNSAQLFDLTCYHSPKVFIPSALNCIHSLWNFKLIGHLKLCPCIEISCIFPFPLFFPSLKPPSNALIDKTPRSVFVLGWASSIGL